MKKLLLILLVTLAITGCGLGQIVKDGATGAGGAIFYAKVKVLRIDFKAREALNPDDQDHPLSVMIRVYQLKDIKTFESADYASLYKADREILGQDLLAFKELILSPGGAVSINEIMKDDTKFVGVAAFFRKDEAEGWRLTILRNDLSPNKPFVIEALGFAMNPIAEK